MQAAQAHSKSQQNSGEKGGYGIHNGERPLTKTSNPWAHLCEHGGGMQQIQEEGADATVHIKHQIGSFCESVGLHADRVVQVFGRGEELLRVLLKQLHTLVPVVLHQATIAAVK